MIWFVCARLWMAIDGEKGATCNLIFAHILFWALGLTAVLNYGYKDPETPAELAVQDPVQSGPSGSGVFIISLFLAIVATLLWCTRIVRHASQHTTHTRTHLPRSTVFYHPPLLH